MSIEKQISIDSEFQGLIPPLKPDEYQGLKESIEQEGCRDALVVWNGLILDGHNRYKICKELNIDYIITEIDLPDREAAKAWIERNQLNRRNLTIDQIRLIRGRLYNRMKNQGARLDLTSAQNEHKFVSPCKTTNTTAEKIGNACGVAGITIRRDAKIAEYLSDHPEEEQKVLQGEKTLTEVKKEKQKTEADMIPAKQKKDSDKSKPKSKGKYFVTKLRLESLREKVDYVIGLTKAESIILVPVTTIRNELIKVKDELSKLEPYRK